MRLRHPRSIMIAIAAAIAIVPQAKGATTWPVDSLTNILVFRGQATQEFARTTSDSRGGAFVAWEDNLAFDSVNVYAQRVGANGRPQWPKPCPVTMQRHAQGSAEMVADGAGGFIIAWISPILFYQEVYLQRIDGSGRALWPRPGVRVARRASFSPPPQLISDQSGGAIVVWSDVRADSVFHIYPDIYAQRVDHLGQAQWQDQGVPVCGAEGAQSLSAVTTDGADGAIVLWRDARAGGFEDTYAQRITKDGTAAWSVNGILVADDPANGSDGTVLADGAGGAFMVWPSHLMPPGLVAQRVDSKGAFLWGDLPITITDAAILPRYPHLVPDNAGGVIVAWTDYRGGVYYPGTFVQRLNGDGVPQWQDGGLLVTTHTLGSDFPTVVADGEGGAIVSWMDYRLPNDINIYAQRFLPDGSVAPGWKRDGVAISTAPRYQRYPVIAPAPRGAIITWQDGRDSWDNDDIYAQRVSLDGKLGAPRESVLVPIPQSEEGRLSSAIDVSPNPVGSVLTISLKSPLDHRTEVTVHDLEGRAVACLLISNLAAGLHTLTWDLRNTAGRRVRAGVYFLHITEGQRTAVRRFVVLE